MGEIYINISNVYFFLFLPFINVLFLLNFRMIIEDFNPSDSQVMKLSEEIYVFQNLKFLLYKKLSAVILICINILI